MLFWLWTTKALVLNIFVLYFCDCLIIKFVPLILIFNHWIIVSRLWSTWMNNNCFQFIITILNSQIWLFVYIIINIQILREWKMSINFFEHKDLQIVNYSLQIYCEKFWKFIKWSWFLYFWNLLITTATEIILNLLRQNIFFKALLQTFYILYCQRQLTEFLLTIDFIWTFFA